MIKVALSNTISKCFGKFANKQFPKPIQKLINNLYVKLLGLDMSEFKWADEYNSLNALFTRELVRNRVLANGFISPTDSIITEYGVIENLRAYQIKGKSYSLEKLLQNISKENLEKLEGGNFINFYLSPKDYHRYHSIYDLQVLKVIHIPAKLYPVNIPFLNYKNELFCENERVILECKLFEKMVYIVLVGALNVGSMSLVFEPKVSTNDIREVQIFEYENLFLKKGELIGYFKMGSTVLIFSEKDLINIQIKDKKIKFGESIG